MLLCINISRVRDAGMKLEKLQNQGTPHYEAWNNTAVQLTKAAEVSVSVSE